MRLEHEFTVAVPLTRAWNALAGADAVAACLPGAQLRAIDGEQTGRIELDPDHSVSCEARIFTVDRDEDDHVATVALQGRELNGPGVGSAMLSSRLAAAEESATRVVLTAEVSTSGHQPGNGFEAAAQRLLKQVGEALEQRALELPAPAEPAASPERSGAETSAGEPRAQTTPSQAQPRKPAAMGAGAAVAAGALIALVVRRRRRSAR
jgi:carbon monoxide dehydrogenase subunit G